MLPLSSFAFRFFYNMYLRRLGVFTLIFAALAATTALARPHLPTSATAEQSVQVWTSGLPMQFEANAGQTDERVKFLSRGPGYTVFLTSTQAVLSLSAQSDPSTAQPVHGHRHTARGPGAELRMTLLGANAQPCIAGVDALPGVANYFVGNDPNKWHTGVHTFGKVKYEEVYPGVDVVYYGNQRQLEYDFIVNPGAAADRIAFGFAGADTVEVDRQGNLLAHLGDRVVQWHKPFAYQETAAGRQEVPATFAIKTDKSITFDIADYDHNKALVIDPVLVYSTYLGGSGDDFLGGITVDTNGNVYILGDTSSLNFPTNGAYDATPNGSNEVFVAKLSASGSNLLFSTYIGGSGDDFSGGIAVDSSGNIYITGETLSGNFPIKNGFQTTKGAFGDAFVSKLGPTGNTLAYSTFLGGPQDDGGTCIAVDDSGKAYIGGFTWSGRNFPVSGTRFQAKAGGYPNDGNQDAFVAKINTTVSGSGSRVYCSWLGGSDDESAEGIAIDSAGNAYIVGAVVDDYTLFPAAPQSDFTILNAFQSQFNQGSTDSLSGISDGFVTKVNPTGSALLFSTFLGGSDEDSCWAIALDATNRIYVVGETSSTNFPLVNAAQTEIGGGNEDFAAADAFVTEFQNTGTNLLYSTYLGGSSYESGFDFFKFDIAVDKFGLIYITGQTTSFDFPLTTGADQTNALGLNDAFVAKINPAVPGPSGLIYSTLMGGTGDNYGMGIAVDPNGNFYVAGMTSSTNFPVTTGAFDRSHNGGYYDTYVAKFASPNDLSESMSASIDPVLVGSNVTFSIQVNNNGRSTFHNVTNTFQVPPNAQIRAVSSTVGAWVTNGSRLLCNIGTLTNNASVTQSVTIAPLTVALMTNVATVTATEPEINPDNNSVTALSSVRGFVDVVMSSTVAPNPVLVSSNVTYSIFVTNKGPAAATSLVVTNVLPSAVSFLSGSTSQGTVDNLGNLVTFTLGTLASNATATMTISGVTTAAGTFSSTNGAGFFEFETASTNNSSKTTLVINPLADLTLGETLSTNVVFAGANLVFTNSITNSGPSTATSVTLTNLLPSGVSFVSAVASQGTTTQSNGIVVANIGSLASNATAKVTITIKANVPGTITNLANVTSSVADPILTNNSASAVATIIPNADLSVSQVASPNPASLGSNVTFTIALSNAGPSSATGVFLTNTLPPTFSFVSALSSQGTFTSSSNGAVFNLGSVVSGGVATMSVVGTPSSTGTFTNTIIATANEPDLNSVNNTNRATVVVNPAVDLFVSQMPSPNPVAIGSNVTFNIVLTNAGPSTATGVFLTNALPPTFSFVSALSSQGTFTSSTNRATFNLGTVTNGGIATMSVVATASSIGTFTNTVNAKVNEIDLNNANNANGATIVVTIPADLSVSQTPSPNPVIAGSNVTFTIALSNAGPSTATGVFLTNTLPPTFSFVSALSSQGTFSSSSGGAIFNLGSVVNGGIVTLSVVAQANLDGTFTNTVNATANEADPNPVDNSNQAPVIVNPAADLSVSQTVSPNPVILGSNVTFAITLSNAGPSTATGVTLTNALPPTFSFVSALSSQGTFTSSSNGATFNLGSVTNGGIATMSVVATPNSTGTFTNTVNAAATETDLKTDNNTNGVTIVVNPAADLSVSQTVSPNPVIFGSNVTFAITLSNAGPSTATGVTLTNALPPTFSFVSALSSQGTFTSSSNGATFNLGSVPSGGIATMSVVAKSSLAGAFTNIISANANETDLNSANNTNKATIVVNSTADLSVSQAVSPNPVLLSSSNVTFAITLSNAGPSTATGVILTNALPPSFSFVSALSSQGTFTSSSNGATFNLGSVTNHGIATMSVVAAPSFTGTFTNTINATANEADLSMANNTNRAQAVVNPAVDLFVSQTPSANPVAVGSNVTFNIVLTNAGPSTATGVILTNALPPTFSFVSASTSQGTFTSSSSRATFNLGSVTNGGFATMSVVATASSIGTFTNTINAKANETDLNNVNNTNRATIVVTSLTDLSVSQTVSPNPVTVGSNVTFAITLSNAGPSTATSVFLTNTLPPTFSFVSALSSQGTFTSSSSGATFNLGSVVNGSVATMSVVARPNSVGTFANTINATANEADVNTANNTNQAAIVVNDNPNLPMLRIDLAGTNALLSWTTNATNFNLQSMSNSLTNNWVTFSNPFPIVSGRYTVTNPMVTNNMFFRLKR